MIAKLIKGKGFRGALEYDLQKQKGYILDSNMAGKSARELASEFGAVRALKPNLSKAVCHVSLSISPEEQLSDEQWKDVAQIYIKSMGYENSQYLVTKHTDTEHPHIHILANRVTMKGEVVSDSYDYKRQELVMRQLEKEYGLKSVELSSKIKRKGFTKGEIEQALRTKEAPVRMKLQDMVDKCMKKYPSLEQFVSEMKEQGVETKLNMATTGRISGISFSLDGVAMKGSDLGKAYTWNSLIKRGLKYEIGHGTSNKLVQRQGEQPEQGQCVERTADNGDAPGLVKSAGDAEAEKHRRIAENFARLAEIHKGSNIERTNSRTRGKGLSR